MRKNIVRFAHALFSFISRYLLVITLAMKLKDVNYKTHWNILVFCDQWKITSYLTLSHWKMSNFVLFLLFRLSVIIKLRDFDLESHWNTLIFFDKKRYGVRFELEFDRQKYLTEVIYFRNMTLKLRQFMALLIRPRKVVSKYFLLYITAPLIDVTFFRVLFCFDIWSIIVIFSVRYIKSSKSAK